MAHHNELAFSRHNARHLQEKILKVQINHFEKTGNGSCAEDAKRQLLKLQRRIKTLA